MIKKSLISMTNVVALMLSITLSYAATGDYPNKPITIINPFDVGGTLDVQIRTFAPLAEKLLEQPVVVVNKTGASGMIGQLAGAQAAPDGYTLTVGSTSLTSNIENEIANGRKPSFTRHDFIPIGSFTRSTTLVVVPYDSPWKILNDLIRDFKEKPNHYSFSSSGIYGATHISAEIFLRATGITARHVPYKGGGPALTAVVGKHVDFATQFPATSIPLMQGKKLRILAALSDERLDSIPDVPTVKELGFDATYYNWVGVLAPKKTPMPIVEKLREATGKVAKDPLFINAIRKLGDEVRYMSGDELSKYLDRESETFAKVLRELIKEKK